MPQLTSLKVITVKEKEYSHTFPNRFIICDNHFHVYVHYTYISAIDRTDRWFPMLFDAFSRYDAIWCGAMGYDAGNHYFSQYTWNPTIYHRIHWFAGLLGRMTHWPSIWCSKYFFKIISNKILCKNCFNSFSYLFINFKK